MSSLLKQTTFSVLDLAIIREGQTAADAFKRSVALAQKAEGLGYKRFWLAEHHNMAGVGSSATAVLIGYVAENTATIRVGSGGIMLPNHSALMVAEQFGTLETLYPGRIDLGLGRAPGTDQITAAALRRGRVETFQDFPEDITAIQKYFSKENSTSKLRAIPGEGLEVPVYILGSSMTSAALAAEQGLPYAFASHFAPAQFLAAIKYYRDHFRPSGKLDKPYVISCVNIVAADQVGEAQKLATSFYQMAMGIVRGRSLPLKLAVDSMAGIWSPEEETIIDSMMACTFIGDKERIRKAISAFLDLTKVDELMITTNVYDSGARLHSYEIVSEIFQEEV